MVFPINMYSEFMMTQRSVATTEWRAITLHVLFSELFLITEFIISLLGNLKLFVEHQV